jgi:hypothetical protein
LHIGEVMVSDKVYKRLPADILTLIDEEAQAQNISRQNAISNLISIVSARRDDKEKEKLQTENMILNKYLKLKDDEITFLREEIKALNRGLTKLAETLAKRRDDESEIRDHLDSVMQETKMLAHDQKIIKNEMEKRSYLFSHVSILFFFAGLVIGMLIIYFIISKVKIT